MTNPTEPPPPYVPIAPGPAEPYALASVMPVPAAPAKRAGWVLPVIVGLVVLLLAAGGVTAWALTRAGGPLAAEDVAAAPPADGGRYDTPQALIAKLEAGGVLCTGYDPLATPIGAVARGSCYINSLEAVVSVYATTADAQRQPQFSHSLLAGIDDTDFVVGLNWTVNCHDQLMAAQVSGVLGGQVVHIPK